MKKLLLIFVVTMTVTFSFAQTNVYHPFPDSNAIWNLYFTGCQTGNDNESYSILIVGDTLISGHTYHKLSTPFVQVSLAGYCSQTHFAGYKGAIRQDTLLKKIFFIPPDSSSEHLLYDFTMQVGDTIKGYLESYSWSADTVISIDSILVGSTYHKRWFIDYGYNIYIIEGVGSTYGLLESSPGGMVDFPDYSITCFKQNGQSLYPDTTTNCQLITSINSIDPISNQVNVFPNPAIDNLTIEIPQKSTIELLDIQGQTILQQTLQQGKTDIDISGLAKGIYILRLCSNDKTAVARIVKE
jgi:hypothetical protein